MGVGGVGVWDHICSIERLGRIDGTDGIDRIGVIGLVCYIGFLVS